VIHGLPGSEKSAVVVHTAGALLRAGFPVLRLNLRGAGPSCGHTRQLYHAGRSEDLHRVLAQLSPDLARNGIALVAFSLGANMMLKALGEPDLDARVRAAVSVSAPIDLAEVAHHLLGLGALRRWIYVGSLLRSAKQQAGKVIGLTDAQRRAIRSARSFFEFDDDFLARFSGFSDAAAYYRESSAQSKLANIRVPTLLIHAPNDPIVPIDAYRRFDWKSNPALCPLLSAAGGHAGFHGQDSRVAWHDRCIAAFLEQIATAIP
jgi:predicted alpha/beta-fold hydrolase